MKKVTTYHPLIGLLLAFFLPGSTYFLLGKIKVALLILAVYLFLLCLTVAGAATPGYFFDYAFLVGGTIILVYHVIILLSSMRPVPRLGFTGVLRFVSVCCVVYTLSLLLLLIFRNTVADFRYCYDESMSPTLVGRSNNRPYPDMVACNVLLHKLVSPKRGDIVLWIPKGSASDCISPVYAKRVVGQPGETIDIDYPFLIVDGRRILEPQIFKEIASLKKGYKGYFRASNLNKEGVPLPLMLKQDEYFLLGDNSSLSMDSRFVGPVKRDSIKGRIVRICFPFSRIKQL